MSELLTPLDVDQQRLLDLVAEGFLLEEFEWPFFDYIEGVLDHEGKDAWAILQTFPEIGRWRYGPVTWIAGGPMKPTPESEIALTVVGMSHTPALRDYVSLFFTLVDFLAECRRQAKPEPRKTRELTVTSEEFAEHWRAGRHLAVPPRLTYQLLEHEPPTRLGGGGYQPADGSWTRTVARELLDFAGLQDITDYVAKLEAFLVQPTVSLPPLAPSPFSIAAALDYLDAFWRLTHDRRRLFSLVSAERTTRLALDLQTADEFAGHLSALAEILRSANERAQVEPPRRERNRALARLEADIATHVAAEGVPRVTDAVRVLENVIALRDAGQHGEAADRGVAAFRELEIPYPPSDWNAAWRVVSDLTVGALNVMREEIASAVPVGD